MENVRHGNLQTQAPKGVANPNRNCKHCLSCLLKGLAQKRELDGVVEKAQWLSNIESAELYVTRARQADAIQRMLGVQPGPWGVPNYPEDVSNTRSRRQVKPLQLYIPLQYTNIKPDQKRIIVFPEIAIEPKWKRTPNNCESHQNPQLKKYIDKGTSTEDIFQTKQSNNNQSIPFQFELNIPKHHQYRLRKSPALSPGQIIQFTWLNICRVAAGMKRKLTPSKMNPSQEPVSKMASFSEAVGSKPRRPSRASSASDSTRKHNRTHMMDKAVCTRAVM
eukprot:TRINITY_DN5116_c0_g1_i1.p2 TRINITY_DN5116_c0_g1~~TRINITY_DN5116_c0_g1_i1.p2  ORF type:complete len:277 (+),score=29.78 TRINITY_DN5116_c0_g1_i1:159-989(+)